MIYLLLFYEFFKVGLFAIGGGLVTVPFLFDLSAKYSWFTTKELADMIAISESTPGAFGREYGYFGGFMLPEFGAESLRLWGWLRLQLSLLSLWPSCWTSTSAISVFSGY